MLIGIQPIVSLVVSPTLSRSVPIRSRQPQSFFSFSFSRLSSTIVLADFSLFFPPRLATMRSTVDYLIREKSEKIILSARSELFVGMLKVVINIGR